MILKYGTMREEKLMAGGALRMMVNSFTSGLQEYSVEPFLPASRAQAVKKRKVFKVFECHIEHSFSNLRL